MSAEPSSAFGVVADARARQRRQRRRLAAMLAMLAALAIVALQLHSDEHGTNARAESAAQRQGQQPSALAASVGFCWFPTTSPPRPRLSTHCVPATPATLLAPGIVTVASGVALHHDPWVFSLQRLRAQGLDVLCPQIRPTGASQCFPYPGEPNSDHAGNPPLNGNPPVTLTPGVGTCAPPVWNVITGLVMRPKLSVYFKSPTGTRRISVVPLDPGLRVPGGAFATIITRGPVTLIARDSAGHTIYTAPVTNRGDKPSFCNGLDGGNYPSMPPDEAQANLQPNVITYPFGSSVVAPAR
jgi:hypothetical protein